MAPRDGDGDSPAMNLRRRKPVDAPLPPAAEAIPAKSLKGHEIAVDGIVYDISDFKHPGGDAIKMFGGNDVSVQYRCVRGGRVPCICSML